MKTDKEIFIKAFPTSLTPTINSLLDKIQLKTKHRPTEPFIVNVDNEELEIPYRIYYDEPASTNLTSEETFILACYFTRHNNGHVREKHLKTIIKSHNYFTIPFVVQLLGEYVQEILQIIKDNLDNNLLYNLGKFKTENPKFFNQTNDRVRSYWYCYHRNIPKKDFVGFQIIDSINKNEKQKTSGHPNKT
jgi:hypothetical protein